MLSSRSYPSKVILLGEYTVIQAAQALAVPAQHFSGKWAKAKDESQQYIHALAKYLSALQAKGELLFELDSPKLEAVLQADFFLQSNIPIGYGLGSSGALCAAIYDGFAKQKTEDWTQLKAIFAQMESHFHGSSSGTDPLISYLDQAMHITKTGIKACEVPNFENENTAFFLLNSGKSRKSEAFINWFVAQCQDQTYLQRLEKEFIPVVEEAIADVLDGNAANLLNLMHQISQFQQQYFQAMLLPELDALWKLGLESAFFKLKICGAGGGGFFLGYTEDWERLEKIIQDFPIVKLSF